MPELSLNGDWEIAHCPDGEGDVARLDELSWIPARVPGEVHWDLLRAGLIPDPFFDLNHLKMRELEAHEFWYRRLFFVPGEMAAERLELVFEGLDCFATVWVNARLVGQSANALVPRRFDVTEAIRPGATNEIVVRLASPIRAVEGKDLSGCAAAYDTVERLWARKSDQCYGWDIALRLVTVGIWRPVRLISYNRAILRDYFFRTLFIEPDRSSAVVRVEAEVELLSAAPQGLTVDCRARCGDSELAVTAPVADGRAVMDVEVPSPKLWWTWDLGEPNLYDLTITLREGPHELGRIDTRVGIRTIRLVQEPEGARERSFVFELNGEKFFARGLNWTPCDAIYPRAEPWKQQRLVRFARHLNCNMLRVWGGGIYEPDQFYAECDAQGIALFHDFPYACAIYPQAPEFLEMARDEAEAAVRRLRNHPSIVLWSGDNENDCAYWWWFGGHRDPWKENRITRQVLPEVVYRLDGTRPYIPSSPYSPDPTVAPQDPLQGDQHIWHHGTPFTAPEYLQSEARFPSEIGHLSCPDLQTVVDMLAEEHRWPPDNRAWDEHFGSLYDWNFRPQRREKLDQALKAWLGEVPSDLPTYVLASQLLQGEAYKTWAEYWRLRKRNWLAGGILLWNLADCWPQFSDAIVDFWLRPKLACNYVRSAFAPIHICFSPPTGEKTTVFALNDTLQAAEVDWAVWAVSAEGAELGRLSGHAGLPPNSVVELADATDLADACSRSRGVLRAELRADGCTLSTNFRLPYKLSIRDLPQLLRLIPPLAQAP
ncbi:MAG: hypothetical protein H5T86_02160 [Armatimonadetes bacterium]|nr:hypothetical protein [Armatimonadota bacterium]